MARAKSKPKTSSRKGPSVAALFLLAVGCFVLSKLFVNRIDAVNYAFAVIGFALFAFAFFKYFKNRKR